MSAVHVSPFVPGQELCGEAPCVPCEELGAGERQTNPDENREGERTRRRGGGRGGRLTTSVLWRSQWGRQPHQVRSMKQVCVLVFVSVGVRVCPRVCGLNSIHFHFYRLLSASCVVSFPPRVHVCVRVCRTDRRPHNWLVSAYHTQQQKLSGFPTTEFSLQKCFPISVIHRWCPRTQQASTFPINSETTHSFHQRLHDWLQTEIKGK